MAVANRTWGEERIAIELLLKLGIRVSPRTVRGYMAPGGTPRSWAGSQRWSTFVSNHARSVLACDFFMAVTATFRVFYIFVVLDVGTRRILHWNVTDGRSGFFWKSTTCETGSTSTTPNRVARVRELMSTKITAVDVHDVRFPTAAAGDGSDAINRGDYSATYVELCTDAGPTGTGLTFTNGQGNEITCAAVRALAPHVVDRTIEEIFAEPVTFWRSLTADPQLRWIGPEKGVIHMATGAVVNAVWDLRAKLAGVPMWRLLAQMPADELVRCIDFHHITDALTPDEAHAILENGSIGWEDRLAALAQGGFPSYTTSVGWLGYSDEKVRALTQQAYAEGWRAMKMKVGGWIDDDVRRSHIIREAIGPDALLMMDANQVWDVDEAIANMQRLAAVQPYWIEEPTHADDILGHARIARAVAPIRVATGEVAANRVIFKQLLQAEAIQVCQVDACRVGGVNEVVSILLMAAKFGVPVCPHAGGVGLCEYVQHLAIFDYLRVGTSLDGRMVEYVDHLHEHFADPVRVVGGRYQLPTAPGYSVTMKAASIAEFSFPAGLAWR
jgi:L-fuconate dehydratase